MTQDYPCCSQCGAAPTSRDDEYCRFCSAPLPWAEYDLRSRRVMVVVSTSSMEEALQKVERSEAFMRARLRVERLQRTQGSIRVRRSRRGARSSAGAVDESESDSVGHALVLGFAAFLGAVKIAGSGVWGFLLIGAVLSGLALWGTRSFSRSEHRSRRRLRRQRKSVVAVGIAELGPPKPASKDGSEFVRKVHCRTSRGGVRRLVADVHKDLHTGDVGIAHTQGRRLLSFDRIEHIGVDALAK
ncbi:MAG: hypothetical protein AAGG01_18825 [Planctomycetota bacterium]